MSGNANHVQILAILEDVLQAVANREISTLTLQVSADEPDVVTLNWTPALQDAERLGAIITRAAARVQSRTHTVGITYIDQGGEP